MRAGSRKSLKVEEGSKDESSKKTVKKAASVVAKYKSSILTRTSLSSRVSEITLITSQRRLRSCENIVKGKKEVAPTRKHPIKTGDKSSPTTGAAVNRKVKDTITKNSDISRTISAKKVQAKREEVNIDHVPGGKSKNSKAATKYSDIAIQMTKKTEKSKSEPKTAKLEKFSRKDLSPARKHPIKNTEKTRASVKGETENSVASNPKKSRGMTVTAVQLRGKSRENNHAVASKSADVPTKQKKSSIAVQKTKKQVKMDLLKESSIKTRQKNVKVTAARKIENDMKSASMKNLILGIKPASAIKSSVNSLPPKKSPKKSVPMLNRTILKKLKGRPLTSTELKRLKRRPLTAAELKKLGPIVPRKQKPKEFEFKGSEWSGNSDDEGTALSIPVTSVTQTMSNILDSSFRICGLRSSGRRSLLRVRLGHLG